MSELARLQSNLITPSDEEEEVKSQNESAVDYDLFPQKGRIINV